MSAPQHHEKPVVIIWEMTRACRLACVHCRAEAQAAQDPNELTTGEAQELIAQVAAIGPRFFILTGGDPSRRADLVPLIREATDQGLRVALSPGATPDFLKLSLDELREAGVMRLSFSLDGATEESHNRFRGVKRAWEWTMRGIAAARDAGLEFQINSTITAGTIGEFDALADLVRSLRPAGWTIFLLVPTGRGSAEALPEPQDVERLFEKLCALSRDVAFPISTTEGQHYRRVLLQDAAADGRTVRVSNVSDAKGFVFISHTGEVCPSGFLPLSGGNIRDRRLIDIYQTAPLFRSLRNPDALRGKCGRCEYRAVCGGSRARAFALTGDPFAEEPLCPYQPATTL